MTELFEWVQRSKATILYKPTLSHDQPDTLGIAEVVTKDMVLWPLGGIGVFHRVTRRDW